MTTVASASGHSVHIKETFTRQNLYFRTLLRLMYVMVLFMACRLIFFFVNHSYFADVTPSQLLTMLAGGSRFDLVAILYTNTLWVLGFLLPFPFRYQQTYQRILKIFFVSTNGLALAMNCADTIYFQFTRHRSTANLLQEFSNETNGWQLARAFLLDYWWMVLVWIVLLVVLWKLYGKPIPKPARLLPIYFYVSGNLLLMAFFAGLFVAGVRGGFGESTRPITLANAGEYVQRPIELAVVLNTPFAVYKTFETNDLQEVTYFANPQELASQFNPVHVPASDSAAFRPMNVMILILESFSREYVGFYNRQLDNGTYRGYAPFMDSLAKESAAFEWSLANGHRSIDAIPSSIASIPFVRESYVTSVYGGRNDVNSLATCLKQKGYTSAFLHGAPNGSMGFWAFCRLAGYDTYFGKDEFDNDAEYDGIWGIWDEPFLQFTAQKMNTLKEPFLGTVFTVSSHHPFNLPEKYKGKFPKGTLPVHGPIGYTDHALKAFFATASKMPWYKNTLFVITADHCSRATHPEYETAVGTFRIPILFYRPDGSLKGFDANRLVQQTDIMPTVLNYLHYDQQYVSFGKDVFNPKEPNFVFNFLENTYQYFLDDYVLHWENEQVTGLYAFRTDSLLKHNLMNERPDLVEKMLPKLKAFIQQYNSRLIHNQMTAQTQ